MKNKGMMVAAMAALVGVHAVNGEEVSQEAVEQLSTMTQKGIETFEWGLLLEAEGGYFKQGDVLESDLVLATVEFTADASVTEWLSGHVGLLWEEDDTEENNLDEAYITIGTDYYAQAGRFYLPFGNFETAFISDPLTLELAETAQSSVMLGYGTELFDVSVGAFKGDDEEVIENGYAAVNFAVSEVAQIGAYWLSDILETGSMTGTDPVGYDKTGGAGIYANFFFGPAMINAEFVSALDEVEADRTPMAYNLEASVGFLEEWVAGIKYEGSEDIDMYETGIGGVVSWGFHDNAAIGLEYMFQQPEDDTEDDGHLFTVQLAYEI